MHTSRISIKFFDASQSARCRQSSGRSTDTTASLVSSSSRTTPNEYTSDFSLKRPEEIQCLGERLAGNDGVID